MNDQEKIQPIGGGLSFETSQTVDSRHDEDATPKPETKTDTAGRRPIKQGQKQTGQTVKRRHQEGTLVGSTNRRRRLTSFPPHPSKLPSSAIHHQRRQRRTANAASRRDTTGNSASPIPANNQHLNHQRRQTPISTVADDEKRHQHNHHHHHQLTQPGLGYTCGGCQRPIKDRFLLSACDKFWHEDCLKCSRCRVNLCHLGASLYTKADMTLCRQDYFELFGSKAICAVCDKLIYPTQMVMRARDNVYHLECFACQLCGLIFCVGDRFHLCENKIVCQYDYDEHIYPIQYQQQEAQNAESQNYRTAQIAPIEPPVAISDHQAWLLQRTEANHQAATDESSVSHTMEPISGEVDEQSRVDGSETTEINELQPNKPETTNGNHHDHEDLANDDADKNIACEGSISVECSQRSSESEDTTCK